ncbi:17786_t:CDS:2, partial [Cetraspora pellucida]
EDEFSNYNSTLGLFYQYDDDTSTSRSQPSTYLAANSEVTNNEFKKIKLSDKGSFTKPFFNFYEVKRLIQKNNLINDQDLVKSPETLKQRTIAELRYQFNELNRQTNQIENEDTGQQRDSQIVKKKDSAMKSFFSSIRQQDEFNEQTEFDKYLLLPRIDQTEENDPLFWWKQQKSNFPILCTLAKKYLAIPASSVPSERLFSDASNH